jgi:hypothetical protein
MNTRILADNTRQLIEIARLRQRIKELEDKPIVDVQAVLEENERLRQRIQQFSKSNRRLCQEVERLVKRNSEHWQRVVPESKYTEKARHNLQLVGENRKLRQEIARLAGELAQVGRGDCD